MIAVLHLADFALQAQLRLAPALAGKPVALLNSEPRDARVIVCNDHARARGVECGQTAPQALARCATLTVLTPRSDAEAEAQAGLLAVAFTVTPHVEKTAPGIVTLGLAGLPAERREPALRSALAQLAALGLDATGGLAATPWLALCAARATAARADPLRVVRDERTFLRALPLSVAEPPPELLPIFSDWGVRTLGELTALSRADIARRLGAAGVAVWTRAAGEPARPLHLVTPALRFCTERVFENPLEMLEPLLFTLRRFVDRLALDLANAGLATAALTLELSLTDDTAHTCALRLPQPTTHAEIVFRCLHTHLETLRTSSAIGAAKLTLEPVRAPERQQGFFDHGLVDPNSFAETLARAVALLGSERVGLPVLQDTHRPDAVRVVEPPSALLEASALAPKNYDATQRGPALRRFRPPRPAAVELSGQRPTFVLCGSLRDAVRASRGPWRSSGDWWDAGISWRREEWDLELERGGVYRLAHTPDGWFLEGEYD